MPWYDRIVNSELIGTPEVRNYAYLGNLLLKSRYTLKIPCMVKASDFLEKCLNAGSRKNTPTLLIMVTLWLAFSRFIHTLFKELFLKERMFSSYSL